MKTSNKFVVSCLIIGTVVAFCGIAKGAADPGTPSIAVTNALKKENSLARDMDTVTIRVGTEYTMRLDPKLLADLKAEEHRKAAKFDWHPGVNFQWRKNATDIPAATNTHLKFNSITFDDVGSYTVVYTGAVEGVTAPLHVGVFTESTTNPTSGTVSHPLDAFTPPPSGGNVICGKTFNRWKSYELFNGPNCTPPSTNYPNPNNHVNFTVDTCAAGNGTTMDTGVQIAGNFSPPPLFCNDDATTPCPGNSRLSSRTITLQPGKEYRVGIYFILGTVGTATNVTFNYRYF